MALGKTKGFFSRAGQVRRLLPLTVLLATPAATCGLSLAELLLRVEAIESSQWIVVDGQGRELGTYTDAAAQGINKAAALIDPEGFEPIRVLVFEDELRANSTSHLWFQTADCSGTPYLEAFENVGGYSPSLLSELFFHSDIGFYAVPEGQEAQIRTMATEVQSNGTCTNAPYAGVFFEAARVDDLDQFVPPFSLVTRAALIRR